MDQSRIVDRIEQAGADRPYCSCGRHTTAVWREGTVYLECATLGEPRRGLAGRIAGLVTGHVREAIVDVPAAA